MLSRKAGPALLLLCLSCAAARVPNIGDALSLGRATLELSNDGFGALPAGNVPGPATPTNARARPDAASIVTRRRGLPVTPAPAIAVRANRFHDVLRPPSTCSAGWCHSRALRPPTIGRPRSTDAPTAPEQQPGELVPLQCLGESLRVDRVDRYTAEAVSDRLYSLPGLDSPFDFRQFSGYLNVDKAAGRNIFYWFAEAAVDAANAPVIFWTNGGPGCSSLIGLLAEHGPFRVDQKGETLVPNPMSWNLAANIFYVEQPAGVGFSYSETEEDYLNVGDGSAALDNYRIVRAFMERYPQYAKNDLYLASESYGGHYIPMLAKVMVDKEAALAAEQQLNFKGFMIGNPYNNPGENNYGSLIAFWGHQLLPLSLWEEWNEKCNVEGFDVLPGCEVNGPLFARIKQAVGPLDLYGLEWPVCLDLEQAQGRSQRHAMVSLLGLAVAGKDEPFVPCEESWSSKYLNREDVQKALHVRKTPFSAEKWVECTNRHGSSNPKGKITYNMTDHLNDMSSYYRELIGGDAKLRILIFSGDADSVCGTAGTQKWLKHLGLPVVGEPWQRWEVDGQIAGYFTKYDGLTFTTVHNSGHEVPMYQPLFGLQLLVRWLGGEF